MSKGVYILDAGHGGIVNGQYVTPGKRSPKLPDGRQLFEGVYNRAVVNYTKELCLKNGISYEIAAPGDMDVSLSARVAFANSVYKKGKPCVYISFHGDAAGMGESFNDANGMTVYTSPGQTKSDTFATLLVDALEKNFPAVKFRKDGSDGDADKEEHFYVLDKTFCPSILLESGFMTNLGECQLMMTEEYQKKVALSVVEAIKNWEKLL